MRVTVLGKSPAWQDAGGACSGYLVQAAGFDLLLDCGNGVFSSCGARRLRGRRRRRGLPPGRRPLPRPGAVRHALTYAPRQQPVPVPSGPGPTTWPAPPCTCSWARTELFRWVVGAWGDDDLIEQAFPLREYDAGDAARPPGRCGSSSTPFRTSSPLRDRDRHASGGGRFTYGADLAQTDRARRLCARDRRASSRRPCGGPSARSRAATSRREAGQHACEAGAGRVLITHFSDELGEHWARADAEKAFGGPVEMAREGAIYDV